LKNFFQKNEFFFNGARAIAGVERCQSNDRGIDYQSDISLLTYLGSETISEKMTVPELLKAT
jgi:hypothetical protein